MKTRFRRSFITLTAALAVTPAIALGATTLSLATWGANSHPQVAEFTKPFMECVEKRSDGQINFRYFPGGQMVKENFVPRMVPAGTVDIALTVFDTWSGTIPDFTVSSTPLWTLSMEETKKEVVPGSPLFQYYDSRLNDQNAKVLAIFSIGPPVATTNYELKVPSDISGKRMRATAKGHAKVLQELGAAPVVMSVGDVYSALQRGTIDGAIGGLQGMVGLKYYEPASSVMTTNGLFGTYLHAYIMNLGKFKSLSAEMQDVVLQCATKSRNHMQQYIIDSYKRFLTVPEKNGVEVFRLDSDDPQWEAWQQALSDYKQSIKDNYSPELLKLINQAGS